MLPGPFSSSLSSSVRFAARPSWAATATLASAFSVWPSQTRHQVLHRPARCACIDRLRSSPVLYECALATRNSTRVKARSGSIVLDGQFSLDRAAPLRGRLMSPRRPHNWDHPAGQDPETGEVMRVCDLVARGEQLLGRRHNEQRAIRFRQWHSLLDHDQRTAYRNANGKFPRRRQ